MRPLRLEVQGLTAYKERASVDFSELDLFAITGPTGAGKTTLVDAMTYALFGEVPRVGGDVKQLVSQGAERLMVELEFTSGGGRYRVHRATGHKGVPTARIERLDGGDEWVAEADRAREVTSYVTTLLGMDYEGFVRSVLLPQGQFERFLSGKPEERRRVLDGLLRLHIYDLMLKRANAIASEHTNRAESLQQALDQYAGATPEALEAAHAVIEELGRRLEGLGAQRDAVADALRTAEALSAALQRSKAASERVEGAVKELDRARQLIASGESSLEQLRNGLASLQTQIKENTYDADLLLNLAKALDLAQRLEKADKRLQQAREQQKSSGPRLEELMKQAESARNAAQEARDAVESAEAHLQQARRQNLADAVRRDLNPGDDCPVCGQKIASLPSGEHAGLSEAETALKQRQEAEKAARESAQSLTTQLAVGEREAQSLSSQIEDMENECESDRARLKELLTGESAVAGDIAEQVRIQTAARRDRERLEQEERTTRTDLDTLTAELASATQDINRLNAEIEVSRRDARTADEQAASGREKLAQTAREQKWTDVADDAKSGRNPEPRLRSRLQHTESELAQTHQLIGRAEAEIKRIEEGLAKATDLSAQIAAARASGTLARSLASLLRVDAFPNYIRERALKVLAQDGSRQLSEISGGRYEFQVDGQEFLVADRWNGGETRSVKTLSGGETFLASLALALALAERLPALGAGEGAGALESLFIDEGFSHLDAETLDIVASALEVIGQGGERMVGVVTHVTELAERMPARIVVNKTQSGSTVTVE
jgi:exonuclease SbcC